MRRCGSCTWVVLFGLSVAAWVSACGSGPYVVLNDRFLELPSMAVTSSGCIGANLGDTGGSSSAGGAPLGGGGLALSESTGDRTILVQVSDGASIIVQRTYDESFFKSGRVDQFTATSTSGTSMMLRFWGAWDALAAPACAPASDDGSRPNSP
jgi:hypothetical protein